MVENVKSYVVNTIIIRCIYSINDRSIIELCENDFFSWEGDEMIFKDEDLADSMKLGRRREREDIIKIIDKDLDRLKTSKYSDNLKYSFEFSIGVLEKLKTQITGDKNNG